MLLIMATSLPDDLLHMVCDQLWEQRDFDTLYHCACSGKQLAIPALASIYRYARPFFSPCYICTEDRLLT